MTVNQKDAIIKKLFGLMEQHYSEFDFSVDRLGAELHMSRAQFFRKIHALTGQTPNELLRLFRIKKAASMIASGENNITGIMYEVGFRSTSHFARSFRNYYGKNPSEYRDSITGH
jgi:AraC-like DNA-binding protein